MLYVVYFISKFCPEKYDAFIFFHTISVIMNRLTLQPKGEGCLTTHQSHCNRLVFCKPIELHRYKAISTDANMLVTQNTITQDQIEEVNIYLEYEEGSRLLTNLGYSFYYNLMQQNMHPADADRYANLNTILGYDVGKDIFTAIDGYVWEHDYDLLELSGSKEDKKILEDAAEKLQMSLDFSKWKNLSGQQYDYLFFEGTGSSGSDNFENGNRAISKTHTFA